jgi:glycosyltransferase involved in cell wall biosynthesis
MSSISYVITVFNKAQCLPKLIEGLKNQQGEFEREFIFVDDGSTDGSFDILMMLAPEINAQVITQHNKGPSASVNTGLRIAKHDWVFLVDGDDYLYPDASITLLDLALKYPDATVCKGVHSNNPDKDFNKFDGSKILYIQDSLEKAIKFYPIGASSSMVNRRIAVEVGGCDERVFIQDYSIALRMSLKGNFVQTNKLVASNIDVNQQRLSGNKLRENHCTALARFFFIKDNLDLAYRYKYYALQCHLRKAWLWHLKHHTSFELKHLSRYISTRIKWQTFTDQQIVSWLREALEVYV